MEVRGKGDGVTGEVSQLLVAWRRGDPDAVNDLFTLVYDDLRVLARRQLVNFHSGQTLAPTAVVHELYSRFAQRSSPDLLNRGHFLAVAARAMRHIVIDYVRRKRALKRDGGAPLIALETDIAGPEGTAPIDLLVMDDVLTRLESLDARQAKVVELRFFGGLELDEIARELDVSPRTIKRDWQKARAFLYHELGSQHEF